MGSSRLEQEKSIKNKSLFDWSKNITAMLQQDENDKYRTSLFDELLNVVESGYAFMPYALFIACEEKLEPDKSFSTEGHFSCYKIKNGKSITVYAK